jgi:hypothetical protein
MFEVPGALVELSGTSLKTVMVWAEELEKEEGRIIGGGRDFMVKLSDEDALLLP